MALDMVFFRIALVGAPGSGKTTVMRIAGKNVKNKAISLDLIPEAATELMKDSDNIALRASDPVEFQKKVSRFQLKCEDEGARKAAQRSVQRYVQLTDRALPDMYVYLSREQLDSRWVGYPSLSELYGRYDAIVIFDI